MGREGLLATNLFMALVGRGGLLAGLLAREEGLPAREPIQTSCVSGNRPAPDDDKISIGSVHEQSALEAARAGMAGFTTAALL